MLKVLARLKKTDHLCEPFLSCLDKSGEPGIAAQASSGGAIGSSGVVTSDASVLAALLRLRVLALEGSHIGGLSELDPAELGGVGMIEGGSRPVTTSGATSFSGSDRTTKTAVGAMTGDRLSNGPRYFCLGRELVESAGESLPLRVKAPKLIAGDSSGGLG